MTVYTIEVRAIGEQYDILAHQVAREILQLLDRDDQRGLIHQPLSVHTAQLYHLSGNLSPSQLDHLTHHLLIDPVTQTASISPILDQNYTVVDVFFHDGVTDTLAESVLTGAAMLGITGIERVSTGRRYYLDGRLSADAVRHITASLLYNPVIQNYVLRDLSDEASRRATARVPTQPPDHPRPYNERSLVHNHETFSTRAKCGS